MRSLRDGVNECVSNFSMPTPLFLESLSKMCDEHKLAKIIATYCLLLAASHTWAVKTFSTIYIWGTFHFSKQTFMTLFFIKAHCKFWVTFIKANAYSVSFFFITYSIRQTVVLDTVRVNKPTRFARLPCTYWSIKLMLLMDMSHVYVRTSGCWLQFCPCYFWVYPWEGKRL